MVWRLGPTQPAVVKPIAGLSEPLLHRVAQGDRKAMQACIDRYGGLVWSMALKLSPSRADAEDATQEIFLGLWQSAKRFDAQRASETTFIAMIARRRLVDRLRGSSRRKGAHEPLDPETTPSQDHKRLEASVEAQAAARALETLPEERKEVLKLALYEGMSHQQIAERTGLPLGTVKSHVRRGLTALREALTDRQEVST